ncbi:MAG: 3-hydroxyacyl-ACP dehydratase FabZ [Candidatus Aminicenantes bacterium]|nr:3-hydroxyacyl-ACP dehydratase FabZ [Candidatus Aminicenantes bacterium]
MRIEDIINLLPHRYPFLLVDKVKEIEDGKRIVGIKNVTINEAFFQGHFPGRPIMPGVLILEAMAQTGAVLLLHSIPEARKKLFYLAGIKEAKFRRPVVPGDVLEMELTIERLRKNYASMKGVARVDGEVAAEAIIQSFGVDNES